MIHCQIPGCSIPGTRPPSIPLLCQRHHEVYQGKVRFSALLFWMVMWTMARGLQARWDAKLKAGEPVWPKIDRNMKPVGDWLSEVKAGFGPFLARCRQDRISEEEKAWLYDQFLRGTTETIQRHTLATYCRMAALVPSGYYPVVRILVERPALIVGANASLPWVESQITRLEPVRVQGHERLVILGPWKGYTPAGLLSEHGSQEESHEQPDRAQGTGAAPRSRRKDPSGT